MSHSEANFLERLSGGLLEALALSTTLLSREAVAGFVVSVSSSEFFNVDLPLRAPVFRMSLLGAGKPLPNRSAEASTAG